MKFTEVIKKSTGDARIMDGYRFVGVADSVGELHSGDVDSFYEGWNGNIERGEDGKLYLVERLSFRSYSDVVPMIWCEVKEENKMKTNTVLARLPIGYNDFGSVSLNEKGFDLLDHLLSEALPDDVVICGDEVIGPVDSDFCQDDFDEILDRVSEQMLSSDLDIWEA